MFFTRTHSFQLTIPKEDFKNQLLGRHVKIHNLDFEVCENENGNSMSIIPHAEQVESIKTLPITDIDFKDTGSSTRVKVTSRMRPIDAGGPFMVVIFSIFMAIAGVILFFVGERSITYMLLGISALILTLFGVRMQMGYFDYVRKVRAYVKDKAAAGKVAFSAPMAHA